MDEAFLQDQLRDAEALIERHGRGRIGHLIDATTNYFALLKRAHEGGEISDAEYAEHAQEAKRAAPRGRPGGAGRLDPSIWRFRGPRT